MNIGRKGKIIIRCRNKINTKTNCGDINWAGMKFVRLKIFKHAL